MVFVYLVLCAVTLAAFIAVLRRRDDFGTGRLRYKWAYVMLVSAAANAAEAMAQVSWFGLREGVFWPVLLVGLLPLCVTCIVTQCRSHRWYACAGNVSLLVSLLLALGLFFYWPWVMWLGLGNVLLLPFLIVLGIFLHVIDVGVEFKR